MRRLTKPTEGEMTASRALIAGAQAMVRDYLGKRKPGTYFRNESPYLGSDAVRHWSHTVKAIPAATEYFPAEEDPFASMRHLMPKFNARNTMKIYDRNSLANRRAQLRAGQQITLDFLQEYYERNGFTVVPTNSRTVLLAMESAAHPNWLVVFYHFGLVGNEVEFSHHIYEDEKSKQEAIASGSGTTNAFQDQLDRITDLIDATIEGIVDVGEDGELISYDPRLCEDIPAPVSATILVFPVKSDEKVV
jgi:hypothetical protein